MTVISNNDIAKAIYLSSKETQNKAEFLSNVVNFLNKKRFLSRSPLILAQLEKIINKEDGRTVAKLTSASKLENKHKSEFELFLKNRYKAKEISFLETIDQKVLGGVKLEIGDEVIDLTLKNKINRLQEHLIR